MHHPPPWSMDVVKGYGWCHIWHNVWLSIHAKHFAQHLQKWLDVPSVECVRFVYLSHCWKVEFLESGLAVREAISPGKCHKAMNTFRTSPLNWSKRAVKAIFHPKLAFVILEKNTLKSYGMGLSPPATSPTLPVQKMSIASRHFRREAWPV